MCEFIHGTHVAMGWGCCRCRVYNGLQRAQCKSCGVAHHEPLTVPPETKAATYYEDGGATSVEILGVELDAEGVGIKLRAVATIKGSPLVNDIPAGDEWDCYTVHDAGVYGGMWRLE